MDQDALSPLRLVTWNVLTETNNRAPTWRTRMPAAAAYLRLLSPAVVGTQEGSTAMLNALVAGLPGYRWVGRFQRTGLWGAAREDSREAAPGEAYLNHLHHLRTKEPQPNWTGEIELTEK